MSRVAQAGPYNLIVRGALVSAPRVAACPDVSACLSYVREAVQRGKLQPVLDTVLDTVLAPQQVGAAL